MFSRITESFNFEAKALKANYDHSDIFFVDDLVCLNTPQTGTSNASHNLRQKNRSNSMIKIPELGAVSRFELQLLRKNNFQTIYMT